MSQTYEIDLGWVPDETYINARTGLHYIAWQIGVNKKANTGLWLIEAVVPVPEPLENLLPDAYREQALSQDVEKQGHLRTVLVDKSIVDVQADFDELVALVTQSIVDGYR